jgi:hypothetical protein
MIAIAVPVMSGFAAMTARMLARRHARALDSDAKGTPAEIA